MIDVRKSSYRRLLRAFAVTFLLVFVVGVAYALAPETLTVSGIVTVSRPPDVGTVFIGNQDIAADIVDTVITDNDNGGEPIRDDDDDEFMYNSPSQSTFLTLSWPATAGILLFPR